MPGPSATCVSDNKSVSRLCEPFLTGMCVREVQLGGATIRYAAEGSDPEDHDVRPRGANAALPPRLMIVALTRHNRPVCSL